jgi:hypothetical protein
VAGNGLDHPGDEGVKLDRERREERKRERKT